MDILPKVNSAVRTPVTRVANTVMLRPIANPTAPAITPATAPILPNVKIPSSVAYTTESGKPGKKKGRPSKEDKRKAKLARASDGIRELLEDDPSKADVYAYFEARIEELNESDSD